MRERALGIVLAIVRARGYVKGTNRLCVRSRKARNSSLKEKSSLVSSNFFKLAALTIYRVLVVYIVRVDDCTIRGIERKY